jgi:hypothetical protein
MLVLRLLSPSPGPSNFGHRRPHPKPLMPPTSYCAPQSTFAYHFSCNVQLRCSTSTPQITTCT